MAADDLRERLEGALLDELERVGVGFLNRADILRRFSGQGPSDRTLFRWAADYIDTGRAGQALVRRLEERAAARAASSADPVGEVMAGVRESLPRAVTPELVVAAGHGPIIEHLNKAIGIANNVIEYAKTPDGKVRNAKLLLTAAANLRQCVETAFKITEKMMEVQQIERFDEAVLDAIREESPEVAERVLVRLRQLNEQWSATVAA